jgi:hypothetical protein
MRVIPANSSDAVKEMLLPSLHEQTLDPKLLPIKAVQIPLTTAAIYFG